MSLKIFAVLLVMAIFIGQSEAAVSIGQVITNAAYPNKCYHEATKKAYEIGEKFTDRTNCKQLTCILSEQGLRFRGFTCSPILITDTSGGWHYKAGNPSLDYPGCCRTAERDT